MINLNKSTTKIKEPPMDSDSKFWLLFWSIVALTIILSITSVGYFITTNSRLMLEQGYVEKVVQTVDNCNRPENKTIWTKPTETNHVIIVERPK